MPCCGLIPVRKRAGFEKIQEAADGPLTNVVEVTVLNSISSDKGLESLFAELPVQTSKCPYMHGSVGVGPYPGYVHGRNPDICPAGCAPNPDIGKVGHKLETPVQTLVREALEFQDLFHHEHQSPESVKAARRAQIIKEIKETGTYNLTYEELQHGARVSWRNAPKCSNRKFWDTLSIMDFRNVRTNRGMFEACLEMLEKAVLTNAATCNMAIFRAQTPGKDDGPRVWNSQLLRFAYYSESNLGDPSEKALTDLLRSDYGWTPPAEPTAFDVLPLVMQVDRSKPPEIFPIPQHYVPMVDIRHPEDRRFDELGLKWYGVPIVANLDLSIGGLVFTACPFNGWYSVTEIVRNFTDESRYNMCVPVAEKLCYNHKKNSTMFKDQVVVDIAKAIFHSFSAAGFAIVDHHTLMSQFHQWYHKELKTRGYCPGNWKWIIPPVSASVSSCYLELNKMTEYTLKPLLYYAPGHSKYHEALCKLTGCQEEAKQELVIKNQKGQGQEKPMLAMFYATVSGVTAKYAVELRGVFSKAFQVSMHDMEDFEENSFASLLRDADLLLLLTSTYGFGSPPITSAKFMAWLKCKGELLQGKPFAVLGFGDSSYPRFCAAANLFDSIFLELGAGPRIAPTGKADAAGYEERAVWNWAAEVLKASKAGRLALINSTAHVAALSRIPISGSALEDADFMESFNYIPLTGLKHLRRGVDPTRTTATVVAVENLLSQEYIDAGRCTARVQLKLGSHLASCYRAGDKIQVFAPNAQEVVEAFADQLGILDNKLDELFMLQSKSRADAHDCLLPLPNTHRYILERYVALGDLVEFKQLRVLARCADDPKLAKLATDYKGFKDWQWKNKMRWRDIFDVFPCLIARISLARFYEIVSIIRPRFYSISSAPSKVPGEATLTVSKLYNESDDGSGRLTSGFCSRHLTSCQPGSTVEYKVVPTPSFRLPLDLRRPILMIASGTGIAPFRSFWQELAVRMANRPVTACGRNILIFGCRHPEHDYLYKDEIREAQEQGIFQTVVHAFSQPDDGPKQYVQDIIKACRSEIEELLKNPAAHIYVCGSSNMAQDVGVALESVAGNEVYAQIVEEGRLHEDVFGVKITDN